MRVAAGVLALVLAGAGAAHGFASAIGKCAGKVCASGLAAPPGNGAGPPFLVKVSNRSKRDLPAFSIFVRHACADGTEDVNEHAFSRGVPRGGSAVLWVPAPCAATGIAPLRTEVLNVPSSGEADFSAEPAEEPAEEPSAQAKELRRANDWCASIPAAWWGGVCFGCCRACGSR